MYNNIYDRGMRIPRSLVAVEKVSMEGVLYLVDKQSVSMDRMMTWKFFMIIRLSGHNVNRKLTRPVLIFSCHSAKYTTSKMASTKYVSVAWNFRFIYFLCFDTVFGSA